MSPGRGERVVGRGPLLTVCFFALCRMIGASELDEEIDGVFVGVGRPLARTLLILSTLDVVLRETIIPELGCHAVNGGNAATKALREQ